MRVKDVMNKQYKIIQADTSLREATSEMDQCGCGYLPVGDHEHFVGAVTERRIVMHGLALGCNADNTHVEDVMAEDVHYCSEDDDVGTAILYMHQVGADGLIVLNDDHQMTGIFTPEGAARRAMA